MAGKRVLGLSNSWRAPVSGRKLSKERGQKERNLEYHHSSYRQGEVLVVRAGWPKRIPARELGTRYAETLTSHSRPTESCQCSGFKTNEARARL